MTGHSKPFKPQNDNVDPSPGQPPQRTGSNDFSGFDEKISALMSAFEEQIGNLRNHISDLETRLSELRASRDHIINSLNEFYTIQGSGEMLRTTQDPLRVMDVLVRQMRKFVEFDTLGVFLLADTGQGIQPLGPTSSRLNQAAESHYSEGIFDWVISERRPVVIPWMESADAAGEAAEKHLVIVPLLVGDHPLGVAMLSTQRTPEQFTAHELRLLYFIASQAAVAIQNALRTGEIAAARDFFFNLLENAADVIFALDQQGRFTYVNPRVEELGYRQEELYLQPYQTLFKQAEIGERILSTLTRSSKHVFDFDLRTRLARNQQFTLSLAGLKNERGEKVGALGILRNVSETKRQQKKLLESERLAAYTQTVITLNHEINNPLTAVLGNIYLLEKDAKKYNDDKLRERLRVIQENCLRIQHVIKKLERIDELKTVSYLGSTKMVDIGGGDNEPE
jgi:PAS domain S-box-containing protein